jgi:hypothetical protein
METLAHGTYIHGVNGNEAGIVPISALLDKLSEATLLEMRGIVPFSWLL